MNISGVVMLEYDTLKNKCNSLANIPIALQEQIGESLSGTMTSYGVVALTDENGFFTFTDVPSGSYRISEAWGYANTSPSPLSYTNAEEISVTPADPDSTALPGYPDSMIIKTITPNTLFVTVVNYDINDLLFLDGFSNEEGNATETATDFIQITTFTTDWADDGEFLLLEQNVLSNGSTITHHLGKSQISLAPHNSYLVQYVSTARFSGSQRIGEIHIELYLNGVEYPGGGANGVSIEGLPINLTGMAIINTDSTENSILSLVNKSGMRAGFTKTTVIIIRLQ